MVPPLLFRCPKTGLMAQAVVELGEAPADGSKLYVPIECPACRGLHLVNAATGKLRSEEDSE
jgi:hypothetical protein